MDQTKPVRRRDPFDEAPDTRFYWAGAARATPLAEVEATIDRGNFAIACAGAPGSGRTMFLYRLAERLATAGARFIHPDRVVACKAREAAGHVPKAWQADSQRKEGKGAAVLILDDVDQLSRAEMAQLRDWWTPLREKPEKVALVVSCTASAVDPDSGSRRQDLRSMIDAVTALQPLAPADIEELICFRLEVAGWEWENVFTQPALEKIAFYAKGAPKRLVQICARVMTLAEESGRLPAGPELVKEAAHQLFLPSHLREFSKQISLGLAPIPGLLNESALKVSPASSQASDTAIAHDAFQEPRARPAENPAAAWLQRQDANPSDAVQHHEPVRHDETASARDQVKDDSEQDQDPGVQAARHGAAPVRAKRRRLRGTVSVVAVCGMAVAAGAIGYVLGQVELKPVEVVRIIPQPEPLGPEGGAGGSLPRGDEGLAPLSETAPAPEIAPAPQIVPAPQATARPPEIAPDAVPAPETAPSTQETGPIPEARPVPGIADEAPTVVPPPADGLAPEVTAEPVEPEPSEAFAGAEREAPPPDASGDAADMAGKEQEAQVSEFFFDWTPPSFVHPSIPGGVDDAGSNDDAASGRTTATTHGAETEQASSSATFTAEDKQEAAPNDRSGVGVAEQGKVLVSVRAVEKPVVRLQRDPVVMRAQTLLAQLDLYRAGIDGLLGERTIAAIRDFQKRMSMAETGKVSEALLNALEAQASAARSDIPDTPREQSVEDSAVEAAETLEVIDIMGECRGKEAEWVYIAAINRHVLCGGLSAGSPN